MDNATLENWQLGDGAARALGYVLAAVVTSGSITLGPRDHVSATQACRLLARIVVDQSRHAGGHYCKILASVIRAVAQRAAVAPLPPLAEDGGEGGSLPPGTGQHLDPDALVSAFLALASSAASDRGPTQQQQQTIVAETADGDTIATLAVSAVSAIGVGEESLSIVRKCVDALFQLVNKRNDQLQIAIGRALARLGRGGRAHGNVGTQAHLDGALGEILQRILLEHRGCHINHQRSNFGVWLLVILDNALTAMRSMGVGGELKASYARVLLDGSCLLQVQSAFTSILGSKRDYSKEVAARGLTINYLCAQVLEEGRVKGLVSRQLLDELHREFATSSRQKSALVADRDGDVNATANAPDASGQDGSGPLLT